MTDMARILAQLPKGTQITVTVDAGALAAAIKATSGGPEYGDAGEVARVLGFSPGYWVKRAKAGKLPGAVQDGPGGRWRLPLESCREHIRGLGAGRRRPVPVTAPTLVKEFRFRAPRKSKASATA